MFMLLVGYFHENEIIKYISISDKKQEITFIRKNGSII